jgi:L-alanine-DL-glutamate epimerase-like enolase superfamily enzyme
MKITEVKTVLLTGPSGNDPFLAELRKVRSAAFIEIHTDSELTGIGETYLGYHAPEIVPQIVEFFKPILVGLSGKDIDPAKLWQSMYHCGNFWCRTGAGVIALAGIEGALWDLKGKMENVPVYELLGGSKYDELPCYATGCFSNYPWSELVRKLEMYWQAGFTTAKTAVGWNDAKSGKNFSSARGEDWAAVETEKFEMLGKHFGDDFSLAIDGHMSNIEWQGQQAWDLDIATTVLKELEKFNILFFEEPLHYNNMEAYSKLCKSTTVPVAGGECLTTRQEFCQYANCDAFEIVQPDASYIGIGAFVDVAKMFAAKGKRVATHAWSSGAGVMENIHAAFASQGMAILEIPPLAGPLHTEVWSDGLRFEGGRILPPQAPGLGVTLTEKTKNKYPFVPGSGEWNDVRGKTEIM